MVDDDKKRVRLPAVLLGVFLAAIICLLTPLNNIYHQGTPLGGGHFPLAPFYIFFLMAMTVSIVAKITGGKYLFNGLELLIIWIQMVIGSGIAYTGFARTFLINLTAPYHFQSMGNMWQEKLVPIIPTQLSPEKNAIELLYNGIENGRNMHFTDITLQIPWASWLQPMLYWGMFILVSYFVMFCIVNILSRQWIHNERMNFPLLQVPTLIGNAIDSQSMKSFLTDRFMLVGLLVPLFLHLLNGLAFYFPSVPQLSTLVLAGPYFPDHGLFSGFHKLKIYIYPAFIGFAFLTSRQISFSFWFFFLFGCLLYGLLNMMGLIIPSSELGITFGPTLSRPEEMQMIGAYGVFFLFLVWLARYHLLEIGRTSLLLKKPDSSRTEWFDVRVSFWGTLFGMGILSGWYISFGMQTISAVLIVCSFFMIMIVATRIICQGGLAYFTLTAAPIDGLLALFGTKVFSSVSGLLAGMSQKTLFVDLRESLMPSLVHGRTIHHSKHPVMLLLGGLGLTVLLSLITSFAAMMVLCYQHGMRELNQEWATRTSITVYENVYRLIFNPTETGEWVYTFALSGALVMLLLVVAYHRFYWWPIHPIGYLTAYSSAMRILWVSFFLGWACNALCMRYGGVNLFKRVQLFFVGMIIGDFLMGGIWATIGLFTDAGYQVLPD